MIKTIKNDLSASIVVFFVALPLCLGIALASGAPLFSGIIAGIVGGVVVGFASGSALGVSGPAAGLAVIVFGAIATLGSWPAFLVAVVLAGILQLIMGYVRAGFIAYFFPSSVIKGMLTGIGLLIILKQIPHALGYDKNIIGDMSFFQIGGGTTLTSISTALGAVTPAAVLISILSIATLALWDAFLVKKHKIFQLIQGPLVVVIMGIVLNAVFKSNLQNFALSPEHLVSLPVATSIAAFFSQFTFPDFYQVTNPSVWKIAVVMAIVASLETLLCVEATDKLDPHKRITPVNRELKAQGLGNIVSGLIGGLPVTQVIVRSSANISFGAKTKLSAILHGFLLLISVAFIASFLNMIPLASLASILIVVGFKLAKPSQFRQMYQLGSEQFVPFIATIAGILFSNLLEGILIGMIFGVFYTLRHSYRNAYYMKDVITRENSHSTHHLILAEEVSFFNKASIMKALDNMPENSEVIIDFTNSKSIAHDVVEYIRSYKVNAGYKNITVKTIGFIED